LLRPRVKQQTSQLRYWLRCPDDGVSGWDTAVHKQPLTIKQICIAPSPTGNRCLCICFHNFIPSMNSRISPMCLGLGSTHKTRNSSLLCFIHPILQYYEPRTFAYQQSALIQYAENILWLVEPRTCQKVNCKRAYICRQENVIRAKKLTEEQSRLMKIE